MILLTIDTETTVKNTVGGNKGSAFCPDNRIVIGGYKYSDLPDVQFFNQAHDFEFAEASLVVGHNIKFDLHHIRKLSEDMYQSIISTPVWDTSIAEYILTAQTAKFSSLDELSKKYGGTQKMDIIKLMWNNGVQTEDMDQDVLKEYLEGDVKNTELVALAQIEKAKKLGMYNLILAMNKAQLATCEMEWNGMLMDLGRLAKVEEDLTVLKNELLYKMILSVQELTGMDESLLPHLNFNSDRQISALVFGGVIKYTHKEQVGTKEIERIVAKIPAGIGQKGSKKGQVRYQNIKEKVIAPIFETTEREFAVNMCKCTPKPEWANANGYSTNEGNLKKVVHQDTTGFVAQLLEYRGLEKQISTYCQSYPTLTWPDGYLHPTFQHTQTDTGRLSCSAPNVQNVPKEEGIKACFTSRYGEQGYIISADYSQIEVIWLAWASNDEAMRQDILNGVDFHCKRLAQKEGKSYEEVVRLSKVDKDPEWVAKRNKIKTFTFQRSYGAGAKKIAEEIGVSKEEVEDMIKAEEALYPKACAYYTVVLAQASQRIKPATHTTFKGVQAGTGYYVSPTGRAYAFKQQDGFRGGVDFSPTELKNYSIQGGATGDLVPMMLGELYMLIKDMKDVKLINTIHDSIMLDVHESQLKTICEGLKKFLTNVPKYAKLHLGVELDLPFPVEIEYGRDWGNMKQYN